MYVALPFVISSPNPVVVVVVVDGGGGGGGVGVGGGGGGGSSVVVSASKFVLPVQHSTRTSGMAYYSSSTRCVLIVLGRIQYSLPNTLKDWSVPRTAGAGEF